MIKELEHFNVVTGIKLENGMKIFLYENGVAEGLDGKKYVCKCVEHKGSNHVEDWLEVVGWETAKNV